VNTRTLLKLSVFATLRSFYKRSKSGMHFEFEDHAAAMVSRLLLREPSKPKPERRNPIVLAEEWQHRIIDGEVKSKAELARALGVSRARVTQVLALLHLTPEVINAVRCLGDPLTSPTVGERDLRRLLELPPTERWQAVENLLGRERDELQGADLTLGLVIQEQGKIPTLQ
jgi:hypothetical protein